MGDGPYIHSHFLAGTHASTYVYIHAFKSSVSYNTKRFMANKYWCNKAHQSCIVSPNFVKNTEPNVGLNWRVNFPLQSFQPIFSKNIPIQPSTLTDIHTIC
ncbi:hypothetical protein POVWA2_021670 [Plasmodium ovale wallikeri]|uniref:Uncharacterized protein n=1 Tax=Plasmodium ovale wallikeri TaxID=864142 RepID=A0A1A8YRQ7_PLAOA|nr:hypothetical protein POVWA1_021690 [Plasmodium ovale wallikeri]SBT34766.1 hypothetical protein POVWA2_021670 [Plasmodium ovale wallikeri]